jgi:hypothetical protein
MKTYTVWYRKIASGVDDHNYLFVSGISYRQADVIMRELQTEFGVFKVWAEED